ncbi:MAG: hypothetical protein AB1806_17530 [Acidobacteriota bacterium]
MVRSLLTVVVGILVGLLIVWIVMSQVPPEREPVERFRMPGTPVER